MQREKGDAMFTPLYTYHYNRGLDVRMFRLSMREHGKYAFHHMDEDDGLHTGRYFTDTLSCVDHWVFEYLREQYYHDAAWPGRAPSSRLTVDVHISKGVYSFSCSLFEIDTFFDGVVEGHRGARVISKNF